jgi:hypothetical protein
VKKSKQDKPCPKCGEPMSWEAADPGEAPTWNCPMGGAPPSPAGWGCDCGEWTPDEEDEHDYEPLPLED